MPSTQAAARSRGAEDRPVRLWLLLLAGPIGYVVGSSVGYDYGTAAALLAALTYTVGIGAYAVFGSQCFTWLATRRVVSGLAFAAFTFVTLVGLHVFTPDEDLAVAIAAGLAVAALIDES